MDPNACLRRYLAACADEDYDEATEAANDYATWVAGGGFLATLQGAHVRALGRPTSDAALLHLPLVIVGPGGGGTITVLRAAELIEAAS